MMDLPKIKAAIFVVVLILLAGCSSTTVRTTDVTPLNYETKEVSEQELLDVGVIVFDPGVEELSEQKNTFTSPEIRRAESRFMPFVMAETLQNNGSWGAVRVIPSDNSVSDVYVAGKILHSDGELLKIQVTVTDAVGMQWFTREYKSVASQYSYENKKQAQLDPFQGLYNKVANDMLAFREKLKPAEFKNIRMVSELKFARSFSPQAFSSYLVEDKKGRFKVTGLPPDNDPLLQRVRSIRERDYLYIDTLQDYYSSFALEMEKPYREWRNMTYLDVTALRELRRDSRNKFIAGAALVLVGIAAGGSGDGAIRTAGQVGVLGGAYLIKTGLDRRAESQLHLEALQELGDSFDAEIQPQVIELEDRTVTLTGTVDNQYEQWREILHDIYQTETGDISVSK